MEHKEVGIRAQFRHDEGDPLLHEPADEVHVTAEPIELGDNDRTLGLPGRLDGSGQLRPAVKCVRALAGLNLAKVVSISLKVSVTW